MDLHEAVAAKRFREDLYFRLNVATATLPPLRDRAADIIPFARHFLALYKARFAKPRLDFAASAIDLLRRHSWPGNIRELENAIQNAVLLAQSALIDDTDLQLRPSAVPDIAREDLLEDFVISLIEAQIARGSRDIFHRVKRAMVQSAFSLAAGNQIRTADTTSTSA